MSLVHNESLAGSYWRRWDPEGEWPIAHVSRWNVCVAELLMETKQLLLQLLVCVRISAAPESGPARSQRIASYFWLFNPLIFGRDEGIAALQSLVGPATLA